MAVIRQIRTTISPFPEGAREAVRIAEVLPTLLKQLKPKRSDPMAQLVAAWREKMPEFVRSHSRPVRVQRDTLVVAADSHASLYELSFYERIILDSLASEGLSPRIKRLRVVVEREDA